MPSYEWLIEKGIGETRAALLADDTIIQARIETDSSALRAGSIIDVRLSDSANATGRTLATTDKGDSVWVASVPRALTQGSLLRVEIIREAVTERGIIKPPHSRPALPDALPKEGASLEMRVKASGYPVSYQQNHQPDRLEKLGWSEVIEQARCGDIDFPGGRLRMALTPALTLFDIDGHLGSLDLALKGTEATAKAITLFDIGGSIGIDIPGLSGKSDRQKVAECLDQHLPPPFERTGVNGFGFLQIIRQKKWPSLPEQIAAYPIEHEARQLLRQACRAKGAGKRILTASHFVIDCLNRHPDWLEALARESAAEIILKADPMRPIYQGDIAVEFPAF